MKWIERFAVVGRAVALGTFVTASGGCDDDGAAGDDPAARAQSALAAKEAMSAASNKTSGGVSPHQSTRNAMEAAGKQQRLKKKTG
jgi:hypothetical protein